MTSNPNVLLLLLGDKLDRLPGLLSPAVPKLNVFQFTFLPDVFI